MFPEPGPNPNLQVIPLLKDTPSDTPLHIALPDMQQSHPLGLQGHVLERRLVEVFEGLGWVCEGLAFVGVEVGDCPGGQHGAVEELGRAVAAEQAAAVAFVAEVEVHAGLALHCEAVLHPTLAHPAHVLHGRAIILMCPAGAALLHALDAETVRLCVSSLDQPVLALDYQEPFAVDVAEVAPEVEPVEAVVAGKGFGYFLALLQAEVVLGKV